MVAQANTVTLDEIEFCFGARVRGVRHVVAPGVSLVLPETWHVLPRRPASGTFAAELAAALPATEHGPDLTLRALLTVTTAPAPARLPQPRLRHRPSTPGQDLLMWHWPLRAGAGQIVVLTFTAADPTPDPAQEELCAMYETSFARLVSTVRVDKSTNDDVDDDHDGIPVTRCG